MRSPANRTLWCIASARPLTSWGDVQCHWVRAPAEIARSSLVFSVPRRKYADCAKLVAPLASCRRDGAVGSGFGVDVKRHPGLTRHSSFPGRLTLDFVLFSRKAWSDYGRQRFAPTPLTEGV